jgi:hypothetical protein
VYDGGMDENPYDSPQASLGSPHPHSRRNVNVGQILGRATWCLLGLTAIIGFLKPHGVPGQPMALQGLVWADLKPWQSTFLAVAFVTIWLGIVAWASSRLRPGKSWRLD